MFSTPDKVDGTNGGPSVPDAFLTHDEKTFEPKYAASFHKLLRHDAGGLLTTTVSGNEPMTGRQAYETLLEGLHHLKEGRSAEATEALNAADQLRPFGDRSRVWINPRAGASGVVLCGQAHEQVDYSCLYEGLDRQTLLEEHLSLGSAKTAAEMIEVYGMALLRDVRLGRYGRLSDNHPKRKTVDLLVAALGAYGEDFVWGRDESGGPVTAGDVEVTSENLFRGPTELEGRRHGTEPGEYLSVFLRARRGPLFPSGCAPHVATLINTEPFARLGDDLLVVDSSGFRGDEAGGHDFATSFAEYVALQNAEIPRPYPNTYFGGRTPIYEATGCLLGDYAHVDNVYEEYVRACDVLTANAINRDPGSPYVLDEGANQPFYKHEGDGPTLGPPDAWALLACVRGLAERVAFAEKWLVARRARPEVMAALVDLVWRPNGKGGPEITLHHSLLPSAADDERYAPVAAFLDHFRKTTGGLLLSQMYPEGSPAHPAWPSGHATVAGACVTVLKALFNSQAEHRFTKEGPELEVSAELDKLATNIALGRNFGGVHYRSDGEHGVLIGEDLAVRFLAQEIKNYAEEAVQWSLRKRDGCHILITVDGVQDVPAFDADKPGSTSPTIYPKSNL